MARGTKLSFLPFNRTICKSINNSAAAINNDSVAVIVDHGYNKTTDVTL
jgi:hypothetical protein